MLAEPLVLPNGRQKPRVLHRPEFDSEDDAHDAVDVMAMCGQILELWQVLLVCITLATCLGRLAASSVGALVARQNGKGGWLEAIAIWSLFEAHLTGRQFGSNPKRRGEKNFTLWTAHELKTSDEAYLRVKTLIQANDDLAAEVVRWDGGLTGQHVIELRDGSRLAFLARSKSSGRGFSPRRVIFDEAQEFSALAHRAMLYATAAQGTNRQLIYTGTVPSDENNSEIWTGVRDAGRAGKSKRAAWAEWSPTGSDSPKATIDPESWAARAQANPALGTERLLHDTIDAEWEAAQSDIEGFLRERLSIWPTLTGGGQSVFDDGAWEACGVDPATDRLEWLGIAVSVDLKSAAIVGVGTAVDDHRRVVKPLAHGRGIDWVAAVADELRILHDVPAAVDAGGPAAVLLPALRVTLGKQLHEITTDQWKDACAEFELAVNSEDVLHGNFTELDAAVASAVKRPIADRWAWGRRKSGDISPLEGATVAHYAAVNIKPLIPVKPDIF